MKICFDCEHFSPTEGCLPRSEELTEADWREDLEGDCRRHPPVVGDLVKERDGHEEHTWAEFPKVMACWWCGEFTPCSRVTTRDNAPLAPAAASMHA